jgi:acyl-ACP thioesterase
MADVDPSGRVRFDATARYLQDVATDDVRDAGVENDVAWVVRRTSILVRRRPRYGEMVEVSTWCSGMGTTLAERRSRITSDAGAWVDTVSLWVSLDPQTLRPSTVSEEAMTLYRATAGTRRVRSRFLLPVPPPDLEPRRWPLRWSDFDLFGHANNVVAWTAVEEEARRLMPETQFDWGQIEYRQAIDPDTELEVAARRESGFVAVWLVGADGSVLASARLGPP